jgi:uncharacterized protein YprB with RNaseH-like and TPR domain
MRTCIFDLETTGFDADFGRLICAVVKEYKQKEPIIILPKTQFNDSTAIKMFKKVYEKYDIIVGHYIKGFDLPYINSKLLLLGQPRLAPKFQIDTYFVAKHYAKRAIRSKSLEHLADVLGFEEQKMRIRCKTWNDARDGMPTAIQRLVRRCISDVMLTEQLYEKMLNAGWIATLRRE